MPKDLKTWVFSSKGQLMWFFVVAADIPGAAELPHGRVPCNVLLPAPWQTGMPLKQTSILGSCRGGARDENDIRLPDNGKHTDMKSVHQPTF